MRTVIFRALWKQVQVVKRAWLVCQALGFCLAPAASAKLNVVATTPDLGAIAAEIGGSAVEVTTMAKPTEDPHFVDAKPSFIVKLNRADVLIHGGAELESGWLGPLLDGARNAKIRPGGPHSIKANDGVTMLEVPTALDRSKGDIHAAGNPHYLVDPVNARIVAEHFAEAFCVIDPASASTYRANLKAFAGRVAAKIAEWDKLMSGCKGREFVAYHNSWLYFANHFGLKTRVYLEPKPGVPPSPSHLAEVIAAMKRDNIRLILVDCYLNRRTAEAVAAKTNAKMVDVTQFPGGVKGAEGGYIELMDYLVKSVAAAFSEP